MRVRRVLGLLALTAMGRVVCPLALAVGGIPVYAKCIVAASRMAARVMGDGCNPCLTITLLWTAAVVIYNNGIAEFLGLDKDTVYDETMSIWEALLEKTMMLGETSNANVDVHGRIYT